MGLGLEQIYARLWQIPISRWIISCCYPTYISFYSTSSSPLFNCYNWYKAPPTGWTQQQKYQGQLDPWDFGEWTRWLLTMTHGFRFSHTFPPGVSPGPCLSLIGRSSGRSVTKLLAPPISDTSEWHWTILRNTETIPIQLLTYPTLQCNVHANTLFMVIGFAKWSLSIRCLIGTGCSGDHVGIFNNLGFLSISWYSHCTEKIILGVVHSRRIILCQWTVAGVH